MLLPFSLCGHSDLLLLWSFVSTLALSLAGPTHPSEQPTLGEVASRVFVRSYVRCARTHTYMYMRIYTQHASHSVPNLLQEIVVSSKKGLFSFLS